MVTYDKIMESGNRFNHIVINIHPLTWWPKSVLTCIIPSDSIQYERLERKYLLPPV